MRLGAKKSGIRDDEERLKPVISKKEIELNMSLPEAVSVSGITLAYIINIEYNNDVNLITIHESIREKFSELLGSLDLLKERINKKTKNMSQFSYTVSESSNILREIEELENDVNSLESGSLWNEYVSATQNILMRYIPLMSDESKKMIIYSSKKQNMYDEPNFTREQIKERLNLITEYISLVTKIIPEKYIKINCIWTGTVEMYCSCGESYQNMCVDDERGIQFCKCGVESCVYFNNITLENASSINTYTRSDYEGLKTFKIAWLEHQGRCADTIPEAVFEAADVYFAQHKKGTRHQFKNVKCDSTGRKPGTTIESIIDFMKACKYTQYYNLYNVFGRDYYGWILPDYSHMDEIIYEAYQMTQTIYESMEKTRKFNINNEARQCLLLLSHDVPVSFYDDFKSMSRSAIISIQEDWYEMCKGTNFKVKYSKII